MNEIIIKIDIERTGFIPVSRINQLMKQFSQIDVKDVSFESDWLPDTSRITFKGTLKEIV